MKLLPATPSEEDAKLVMRWRNDPDSLRYSNETEKKVWPGFFDEYRDAYFSYTPLLPQFITIKGKRVGFIRFREEKELGGADISINIDPEMRGRGIGLRALRLVKEMLRKSPVEGLVAEVKRENQISLSLFIKAGYHEIAPRGQLRRFWFKRPTTFVIAEAGSNWKVGDGLKTAKELVRVAARAGADAVKFQMFRAESTYAKGAGKSAYLGGAEIHSLFHGLEMPEEFLPVLGQVCAEEGIEFMASVFSLADLERVNPYVKRHKIASYEISHLPLIREVGKTGKPLFLSTGASSEEEIALGVESFEGKDLTLMQCTAKYPAPVPSLHLRVIPWLKERFRCAAGLSDHSQSISGVPAAAVALGATAIEKHFTLDRSFQGPDHSFAIIPAELSAMIGTIREVEAALGNRYKEVLPEEEELFHFAKRRLQAARDIAKGEPIVVEILRPGNQPPGAHPVHYEEIEGKRAARALKQGEGVTLGDCLP